MQLVIFILAAFGLGYWFARSNASQRLSEATRNIGNRLRRKPEVDQPEGAEDHAN
jgi:hypothetical protein